MVCVGGKGSIIYIGIHPRERERFEKFVILPKCIFDIEHLEFWGFSKELIFFSLILTDMILTKGSK